MFSEPQYKPRGQVELPFVAAETRGTARSRVPPRSSKVWRKQRSLSSDGAPRPACCSCLRSIGERNRRSIHVASVPVDGDRGDVAKTAQLEGRILGATEEEVKATTAAVSAALQHQLRQRAREAAQGNCHRELPVTLQLEDGTLVEGVADLVREGERWIVMDFKTDQELASGLERHRRQSAIYATAVRKANDAQSEAFLLRV